MKRVLMLALIAMSAGCATKYVAPVAEVASAALTFELLTESGSGGGNLAIGTSRECEADSIVSTVRRGHHFLDDVNIVKTRIAAGQSVTLMATAIDTVSFNCETSFVFTPEAGKSYYATFQYDKYVQCRVKLYEGESASGKEIVVRECE